MKSTVDIRAVFRNGQKRMTNQMILLRCLSVLLFLSMLVGCASINGFPDRPERVKAKLESLQKKFFLPSVDVLEVYASKDTEAKKRNYRDQVVNGRLLALDMQYAVFKKDIYEQGITSNLVHDISGVAVGAAGAVVTATDASRILSALSGGISGSRTSINKNLYYERTMPALLALMDAERKSVRADIMQGLTQDTTRYPLGRALGDLERYLEAGSIPGAVATLTATAGETEAKAKTKLEVVRTKDFVDPEAQRRIASILESVKQLPAGAAWDILQNPPSEIDKFVMDAVRRRLNHREISSAGNVLAGNKNDQNAKDLLKMIIVLMSNRSPENILKWQAAIEALKK